MVFPDLQSARPHAIHCGQSISLQPSILSRPRQAQRRATYVVPLWPVIRTLVYGNNVAGVSERNGTPRGTTYRAVGYLLSKCANEFTVAVRASQSFFPNLNDCWSPM